jgi:hypothetical protein
LQGKPGQFRFPPCIPPPELVSGEAGISLFGICRWRVVLCGNRFQTRSRRSATLPKQMGLIGLMGLMGPIEVSFITLISHMSPIGLMSPIFLGCFACFFEFDLRIAVDKIPIYCRKREVRRQESGVRIKTEE